MDILNDFDKSRDELNRILVKYLKNSSDEMKNLDAFLNETMGNYHTERNVNKLISNFPKLLYYICEFIKKDKVENFSLFYTEKMIEKHI